MFANAVNAGGSDMSPQRLGGFAIRAHNNKKEGVVLILKEKCLKEKRPIITDGSIFFDLVTLPKGKRLFQA